MEVAAVHGLNDCGRPAPRGDLRAVGAPVALKCDGSAPLQINQDARIFAGTLAKGDRLKHAITGQAYLLVSEGKVTVNGKAATKGDGVAMSGESHANLAADSDAEILIIEVPGKQRAR